MVARTPAIPDGQQKMHSQMNETKVKMAHGSAPSLGASVASFGLCS